MTEEKPLHVRVAEALGNLAEHYNLGAFDEDYVLRGTFPRYDTDWAATGPLIERYNICVYPSDGMWEACWTSPSLVRCQSCESSKSERYDGDGPTPLVAVCSLILALKERGKL